jgi:hypothetical protein
MGGEVGVLGGGQNTAVAENLLDLKQIKAGLDQVRGVAMAQAVRGDLFLFRRPQSPCAA